MPSQPFSRPALGQTAELGTLYNVFTDQFTSRKLFSDEVPEDAIKTKEELSTEWKVSQSDSLKEKLETFGLSASLQASCVTGLLETSDSGDWLTYNKASNRIHEASTMCTMTAKSESIDWENEDLKDMVKESSLRYKATHVISKIHWGAITVVVGRGEADVGSPKHLIESIRGAASSSDASETGLVDQAEHFKFKVFSDVSGGSKLSGFGDICRFIHQLPDALGGGKANPIAYKLIPIAEAAELLGHEVEESRAAAEVSGDTVNQLVNLFQDVEEKKRQLTDYLADLKLHTFCVPVAHVNDLKPKISEAKKLTGNTQATLGEALKQYRQSDSEELDLRLSIKDTRAELEREIGAKSIVGTYGAKMAFADEMKTLGAHYLPNSAEEMQAKLVELKSADVYVLYLTARATGLPSWELARDKAIELAKSQSSGALEVLVIDCDMEKAVELDKALIEHRCDGQVLVPDLMAEIQALAGRSLLRWAEDPDLQKRHDFAEADDQKPLKIPCPGAKCSSSPAYDWICPTCKDAVTACFEDEYLCCGCGRYKRAKAVFKCQGADHGPDFLAHGDDAKFVEQLKTLTPYEQCNILILGKSGVGKSTFINAFANWMVYDSLDDCIKDPELRFAIPARMTISGRTGDYITEEKVVTLGSASDLEDMSNQGQSATQTTVTYCMTMNNKVIRLIDTPGMGDTRGVAKDQENVEDILRTLSSVKTLNAIFVLMKTDDDRFDTTFEYILTEILAHLHKDAMNNIIFGFPRSSVSHYQLGGVATPLRVLLKKQKISIDINNPKFTYFFCSETFIFQAGIKKAGIEMPNKQHYVTGWNKSIDESRRFVKRALQLPVHDVQKTINLQKTRELIIDLTEPMVNLANLLRKATVYINDQNAEIKRLRDKGEELAEKLKRKEFKLEKNEFDEPRTVCTDNNCKRTVKVEGSELSELVFNVCHNSCQLRPTLQVLGPTELLQCWAFEGRTCKVCHHELGTHMHVKHEWTQIVDEEKMSAAVRANIENGNSTAAVEQFLAEGEAEIKKLKGQDDRIKKGLATFGVYLEQRAIVAYNDKTIEYLDFEIGRSQTTDEMQRLKEQKKAYEKQADQIRLAIKNKERPPPTEEELTAVINDVLKIDELQKVTKVKPIKEHKHISKRVQLRPTGITHYDWMDTAGSKK